MAKTVNEKILSLLKKKNMTQKELAKRAGITESAVSHYISGDRVPRGVTLVKIANALETTTDNLLLRNGPYNKSDDLELVKTIIARNAEKMSLKERKELISIILDGEE